MSGWRRIAILLSAVWMVGGSVYFSGLITDSAARRADLMVDTCEATAKTTGKSFKACWETFSDTYVADLKTDGLTHTGIPILDGAVFALIALFAGWLAFGAVYAIVAWGPQGFRLRRQAGLMGDAECWAAHG